MAVTLDGTRQIRALYIVRIDTTPTRYKEKTHKMRIIVDEVGNHVRDQAFQAAGAPNKNIVDSQWMGYQGLKNLAAFYKPFVRELLDGLGMGHVGLRTVIDDGLYFVADFRSGWDYQIWLTAMTDDELVNHEAENDQRRAADIRAAVARRVESARKVLAAAQADLLDAEAWDGTTPYQPRIKLEWESMHNILVKNN